ncbi:MAG TPA: EAL domain-containing protein [Candidatus Tectomicrobia bacterium]|nr:EAL domain-containing protein [Candidatus Tectomicrobia bacterium]
MRPLRELSIATKVLGIVGPFLVLAALVFLLTDLSATLVYGVHASPTHMRLHYTREAAASLARYSVHREEMDYRRFRDALDAARAPRPVPAPAESVSTPAPVRVRGVVVADFESAVTMLVGFDAGARAQYVQSRGLLDESQGHRDALEDLGRQLRRELLAEAPNLVEVQRLSRTAFRLSDRLAALEKAHAEAMRQVADRILGWLQVWTLIAVAAITLAGVAIAALVAYRLRRAINAFHDGIAEVAAGNFGYRLEIRWKHDFGLLLSAFNRMTANLRRVKERAEVEARALRKALQELEGVMETIPDVIAIVDREGKLDLWNRNLEIVTGRTAAELKDQRFAELFGDRAGVDAAFRDGLRKGKIKLEAALVTPDGQRQEFDWTGAVIEDEQGQPVGLTLSGRNITERKALEAQLAHQAFHDPLTGLANRVLFMDRLTHAFAKLQRRRQQVAVLFVDLDRFKVINDSLGHHVGDQLLVEVSRRIRACVRPEDTVARLGGDEFAVLLESVNDRASAMTVAERITEAMQQPFMLSGREIVVTASVGIAFGPKQGESADDILRHADMAMYQAKGNGKARCEVFSTKTNEAEDRLGLEIDLRGALARDEFLLEYQPIVSLQDGRILEAEALVRWVHPRRGLLRPTDFIEIAEETGLIVALGKWVLGEACRHAREWQRQHPGSPPVRVAVNLSARQLREPTIVQDVREALAAAGLPASALRLEITESLVLADLESTASTLVALKELGVELAIDDFGTGYSSLGYLSRLSFNSLKIDRVFVANLERDKNQLRIIEAIVALAKAVNLSVTAEGVETAEQVKALRALGVDAAQGHYFATPLTAEALEELLAREERAQPADRRNGRRGLPEAELATASVSR